MTSWHILLHKAPKTWYIDYIERKLTIMTTQTFKAPTLPTPATTKKQPKWNPNMATRIALVLFVLV